MTSPKLPLKISQSLHENSKQSVYNDGSFFFEDITKKSENYTHAISAIGGFDTCSFILKGTQDYLDDWFKNGLMRDVRKENPQGNTIWNGYITRMSYNLGRTTKTKTLDDLFNRVYIRYSPILGWVTQTTEGGESFETPITGAPGVLYVDNDDSIDDWGYKTAVINGGERTTSRALDWADTIINEVAKRKGEIEPQINDNPFISTDQSITVECKGYWHMLDWVPYSFTSSGYIAKSELIKLAIQIFNSLNPGYFDTNFSSVESNPELIQRNSTEYASCLSIIKTILQDGGPGGYRWVGGIYNNQEMVYKRANTRNLENLYGFNRYVTYAKSTDQKIYDEYTSVEVKPWDLRPDNILITRDKVNTIQYIEQAIFTEPYQYQLMGGDDGRLTTLLNQKGLPSF